MSPLSLFHLKVLSRQNKPQRTVMLSKETTESELSDSSFKCNKYF